MKNMTWLAGLVVALGVGASGASAQQLAQQWRGRDVQVSYATQSRIDRLRTEIARDRMRLNENLRLRKYAAAQRNREELARDQRELNALLRVTRNSGWQR